MKFPGNSIQSHIRIKPQCHGIKLIGTMRTGGGECHKMNIYIIFNHVIFHHTFIITYIIGYVSTTVDNDGHHEYMSSSTCLPLSTCFARIYSFHIVLWVLLSGFPDRWLVQMT